MEKQLEACLDLLRRLPPQNIDSNLSNLIQLVPELEQNLLNSVDVPVKIMECPISGREFIACSFNREQDSFRSPWSNVYVPEEKEEGKKPVEWLRDLEQSANVAFDTYKNLYYEENVVSSVYFWNTFEEIGLFLEEIHLESFAGAILIKKVVSESELIKNGNWDSIHVIEAKPLDASTWEYRLTSTVILSISSPSFNLFELSGNLTKQVIQSSPVSFDSDHIINIGKMVEEMESNLRSSLQEIYFGKTHDIVNNLRSSSIPQGYLRHGMGPMGNAFQQDLAAVLSKRGSIQ